MGADMGFIALENDYNTIYGAAFDHKTETLVLEQKLIKIFLNNLL